MQTDPPHLSTSPNDDRAPYRPLWVAAAMVALIGAFYLLREHWGHVAGYWPYLLLLACPAMHLFHGHHGRHRPPTGRRPEGSDT